MSEYIITKKQIEELNRAHGGMKIVTSWLSCYAIWDTSNTYPVMKSEHVAVDLPEIVRCRDCRHATISTTGVCKYCEMFVLPDTDGYGADAQVNLPLDFFCAWAERRDA